MHVQSQTSVIVTTQGTWYCKKFQGRTLVVLTSHSYPVYPVLVCLDELGADVVNKTNEAGQDPQKILESFFATFNTFEEDSRPYKLMEQLNKLDFEREQKNQRIIKLTNQIEDVKQTMEKNIHEYVNKNIPKAEAMKQKNLR